jgi:biotin carboxyl carrier protein
MFENVIVLDEIVADTPAIRGNTLVISPCNGRFVPLPPEIFTCEGEWVEVGTRLALIQQGDRAVEVISSFRGWVMKMMALPGQPVKEADALFWIYRS